MLYWSAHALEVVSGYLGVHGGRDVDFFDHGGYDLADMDVQFEDLANGTVEHTYEQ